MLSVAVSKLLRLYLRLLGKSVKTQSMLARGSARVGRMRSRSTSGYITAIPLLFGSFGRLRVASLPKTTHSTQFLRDATRIVGKPCTLNILLFRQESVCREITRRTVNGPSLAGCGATRSCPPKKTEAAARLWSLPWPPQWPRVAFLKIQSCECSSSMQENTTGEPQRLARAVNQIVHVCMGSREKCWGFQSKAGWGVIGDDVDCCLSMLPLSDILQTHSSQKANQPYQTCTTAFPGFHSTGRLFYARRPQIERLRNRFSCHRRREVISAGTQVLPKTRLETHHRYHCRCHYRTR